MKLKSLLTRLALQQIKEVCAVAKKEHVSIVQDIECTCKIQWYMIVILRFINFRHSTFHYSESWEIKTV